ncbi:hypothetical protein M440DRAFT_1405109 [Trichoderma longibrachiatum ATCC 18648]|uniref:Uncharacterized protein n=1 Tax=Trichoderma longibrachiatum ATCC 18648 TaxID=983965 RepID=A0A2T4BTN8_TRILO|nr:hypothetical protein M440DRAFT_1405109 [Trichoderma longibrachiatum ATCC 18648]
MPPTGPTSAANVGSEKDCFELLALEFSSLPDREMAPEGSDAGASQQQQVARAASGVPSHTITSNTPTNSFIARTIRAAMGEIKPKP